MILSRRRTVVALLTWPLAPAALRAQSDAVVVEGHAFARRVQLAGTELQLNGTGVRAVAWFKGYATALYLRQPGRTAAQVLALDGPKRLQLVLLQTVPAQEFVKAVRKGVHRNTEPPELPALEGRLKQFEAQVAALGTVRKGDLVNLDLEPGVGTRFTVNGTLQGDIITGDDFFAALLRSFVGDRPYDRALRAGLLGQGL